MSAPLAISRFIIRADYLQARSSHLCISSPLPISRFIIEANYLHPRVAIHVSFRHAISRSIIRADYLHARAAIPR
jgi:hypothetical protein